MPQSWKEWAGREDGQDWYRFGDFVKGIRRRSFGGYRQHQKVPVATADETRSVSTVSESSTDEFKPYDRAATGLRTLRTGLNILCEMGLLHGANGLEKIRLGIEELETQIEETLAYQQLHPESGTLLQVQVCSAAGNEDPPEWSMGKLYASTDGLIFESMELPTWRVGPVKWSDIASLQTLRGGDVRLEVLNRDAVYFFAGVSKLDVLEKYGDLKKETPIAKDTECLSPRKTGSPSTRTGRTESVTLPDCTPDTWLEQYTAGGSMIFHMASPASFSGAPPMMSFVPIADQLPDEVPTDMQASVQVRMPKATIEGIREVLSMEDNWPLSSFLVESLQITDVEETVWASSHRIPGTLTRRLRFRMPLPADIPQAVKKLVSLPETTQVTFLARLGCSADKIILVQEACSHDVTYGENFWAQDVLAFTTDPAGGVLFEKFANIRWVVSLPWYAGVLGTFIEMKAKADSKNAGIAFAKYLEREFGM